MENNRNEYKRLDNNVCNYRYWNHNDSRVVNVTFPVNDFYRIIFNDFILSVYSNLFL